MMAPIAAPEELRAAAAAALAELAPSAKCAAVAALWAAAQQGVAASPVREDLAPAVPGRPARPLLVHPARVARRGLGTPAGRIALVHALAHIEFNAINLALDAVARFAGLPGDFYTDWLSVAAEEALHFRLLEARLAELGAAYGDLPAHDGLWDAAQKTRRDPLARMALVPRMLEARGLDVTPGLQMRLRKAGDTDSAALLEIILRDEIRHVAIGNRWYTWLCAARGLDPVATFRALCAAYGAGLPHPPFNLAARRAAGFPEEELSALLSGPAPPAGG
jgi:uncharacterized ferritin-like protein (DUF455 family)